MKNSVNTPTYKIYALKYAGPVPKSGAHLRWQKDWDKKAYGNYYIWCIKNARRTIVVDTGCTPKTARQKGLPNYVNPALMLQGISVEPKEIEFVILTHLHWDHAGGAFFFPHASFFIHEKEYAFWTGDQISASPPFQYLADRKSLQYIKAAHASGRVKLIKNNRQIFPGIGVIFAPGHSPGLMAVSVNTAKGTVILGSDSAFIAENYIENWPHDVAFNMADYMKTMAVLRKKVSSPWLLFAGHDPAMLEKYHRIAPDVTRLA